MKAANEASLRAQQEQRIRELEGELSRLRGNQNDSLSQKESALAEVQRYRELYSEELQLRKNLAAKLERCSDSAFRFVVKICRSLTPHHTKITVISLVSLCNHS